jgi:superfamily II DNA or RNA helicase
MLEPRPYQTQAIDAIESAFGEGVHRPLVVHPTGTGKTVTFAHLLKKRVSLGPGLILVHREELASQAVEKLSWIAPELSTGVVKAARDELDADVVVASVQTAHRDARLARLRERNWGTIVVDEAHHAPAPTYLKILKGLGSYSHVGPLTAGFTATPERDKGALGVWERVVAYMSIREAIYQDYLCPILPAQVVETEIDLDTVRKDGGDYAATSLGEAIEASGAIDRVADAYLEHASDRKGLAFTPTVKTAYLLAEALRRRGITSVALDGTTPDKIREKILEDLRTGKVQAVVNCGVLTEGFDEPSISCVAILRPTTSHNLYVQMVGRGTRKSPGKKDLLLLDMVGASKRHELISLVDLDLDEEGARSKKDGEAEKRPCPKCATVECEEPSHRCELCGRYLPHSSRGRRHRNCQAGGTGKVDVFGASKLRWLPVGEGWCLGGESETVVLSPTGSGLWRISAYRGGKIETLHDSLPDDWAMNIGEDRVKAFGKINKRTAQWLADPPSDAQRDRLLQEGLPQNKLHLVTTKGAAADLITRIQGRRAMAKIG